MAIYLSLSKAFNWTPAQINSLTLDQLCYYAADGKPTGEELDVSYEEVLRLAQIAKKKEARNYGVQAG